MHAPITRVQIIDSHTGGEPTRVVLAGGPDLGRGPLAERAGRFREEFDEFRSAIVNEPRGSDAVVGALLCEPFDSSCAAGVIFFNNVGTIGMCGHGTIGLVETLAHLGRIDAGEHGVETPVGIVTAMRHEDGEVGIRNVASFRRARDVRVDVPGRGSVRGDVAWGGNWFFLVDATGIDSIPEIALRNVSELGAFSLALRSALRAAGITGDDGAEIDHIELFGPPSSPDADSRNFVLCPGGAYDRSPCGTGTSAKVACLVDDGKLTPGEWWRQESVIGSVFRVRATIDHGAVVPEIRGRAHVTAEATLILRDDDPFRWGIRP